MFCQVIVDIAHDRVARPFLYRIPEGMTLQRGQRVLVPFGPRKTEGVVLNQTPAVDVGLSPEKIRDVIAPLEDFAAIPPELMDLAEELARKTHSPLAETIRLMMPAQMRGGRVKPRTEKRYRLLVNHQEAERILAEARRETRRTQVIRLLLDGRERSRGEISEAVPGGAAVLTEMIRDEIIGFRETEVLRTPDAAGSGLSATDPGFTLTPCQQEALGIILPAVEKGDGCFLIHGVTSSGKTEVFMAAVRKVLSLGRSAIMLVPEIALTPQMVSWFRSRFGSQAAVIHSRLSAGERYDEWRRIRRGDARIVIGARSAVFSPVRDLGLIVVDEEHESTYFSDRRPQYDAREVAESRCQREGASLILASATPSILSFARARRGDFTLIEMPQRANRRPLPEVTLVDMRQELEEGNRSIFSREMKKALKECVSRGEQAMLLMNRRGYHSFVSCRSCGKVIRCPRCDLSLTYHAEGRLQCHYCGHLEPPPVVCPECGSRFIRYFGAGTQQVEAEVAKLIPGVATVRMDHDTTGGKDGHRKALEIFRSGRASVLIGTQMIAKGLDFPGVTLVGVVAADITLNLPDYRSRERTFQLLTQAAGRAGRGRQPGRVIIQTYRPEDDTLCLAARQDFRAFFEKEFLRRRRGLYPPFTVMARVLCESRNEEEAEQASREIEMAIHTALQDHPSWGKKLLMITRDTPPAEMLKGAHRRQVFLKMLKSPEADEMLAEITMLADRHDFRAVVRLEMNPVSML